MTTDFVTPTTYTFNEPKARATTRQPRPAAQPADEAPAFPTTPIYATTRKSSAMGGVSPASIIGGGVVLAVFAAGIFAISQAGSEPAAVAEPTQIAAAPMAPAAITPQEPAGQPVVTEQESAAAEAAATQRTVAPEPAAPAAPAAKKVTAAKPAPRAAQAAPAAVDTADDAATMLPDGPMPYVPDTASVGEEPAQSSVITPPPIAPAPAETTSPATAIGPETSMVPSVETTPAP